MKNLLLLFVVALLLTGCGSSIDIPTKEESLQSIHAMKPEVDHLDSLIALRASVLPKGSDLVSRTRSSAVNLLLSRVTNRSLADIHIDLLATRPLWKEEKSILGIGVTNYVDIDSGAIDIDMKKFQFLSLKQNVVDAALEIEGMGTVRASGKYTGIAASVSPQIHFYVDDHIQFVVTAADSDYIRLNPVPQTVMLKAKVTVAMLGLNLPYYREIPLQTTDLVKPVLIPSAVRSEIVFPLPAAQYGSERLQFVKRFLKFTNTSVRADGNVLEYRSNIEFSKE